MGTFGETIEHEMETILSHLLLQIIFILFICKLIVMAIAPLKQPPVVGEIIAGLLMGPTVMGQSENFKHFMFPDSNKAVLKAMADIGIVFFMFILGLEFRPADMLATIKKTWHIGLCGIALPFGLGCSISNWLYSIYMEDTEVSRTSFLLFVSSTMSFTAFPVLARILLANNALTAQIGQVAMGVASIDDILAWTVLAMSTAYHIGGSLGAGLLAVFIAAVWIAIMSMALQPGLRFAKTRVNSNTFALIVFACMCVSALVTQLLGLHAFFGAFVFGICVPKEDEIFIEHFMEQIEVVTVNFFVPLFFCNTGLRTDLTTMASAGGPVITVLILSIVGKMIPPIVIGKLTGFTWSFSFQLAALMSARGLIALIALDVALEVGAFTTEIFGIFVIMALVTTMLAGPLFALSYDPKVDPPADAVKKHGTPEAAVPINAETPMQAERNIRRHSVGDTHLDPEFSLLRVQLNKKQDTNYLMLKNLVTEMGTMHERWSIALKSAEVVEGELASLRSARELASSKADTVVPVKKTGKSAKSASKKSKKSTRSRQSTKTDDIELGLIKSKSTPKEIP